jgi:hypothetical protein
MKAVVDVQAVETQALRRRDGSEQIEQHDGVDTPGEP